jgi:hypothetical protein
MPYHPDRPDGSPSAAAATPIRTAAERHLDEQLQAAPFPYSVGRQAALRDLEAAVGAVVDELRARQLGPEKVLVAVKARVATQARYPDDLLDDVVRWCIVRYYAGPVARAAAARGRETDDDA